MTDSEKLQRADEIRLNDFRQSRKLLDSIDVNVLNATERELYLYLDNWLLTTVGDDLLDIYQRYAVQIRSFDSDVMRSRALISRLSLASYIGKWTDGFEMANQLQDLLSPSLPDEIRSTGYSAMVTFYNKADQPRIAWELLERWESITEQSPEAACQRDVQKIVLLFEEKFSELSLTSIQDAQLKCERVNNSFMALYSETFLFYYLVKSKKTQQANVLLEPLEKKIEEMSFVYMRAGFYAYVADLYTQQGRLDKAKEVALNVLQMDEDGRYLPTKIQANEILIDIAKQQANFEQAVAYMETLESLRADFRELSVVKQAAFQQVNFELALKQSQIDLLDKRNKLLETRSELSRARVQTSLIALCFVGVVMLGLLAWIWRSRKLQKKLSEMARIDSLTGIFNRGFFLQSVKQRLIKAEGKDLTCCLLLLDLDHFKRVNDTYGHQAGDWVLTEVVRTLKVVCDERCTLGRMGGEEFAVFVYDTDLRAGLVLAEQCRSAIEGIDTAHSGYRFPLTASFGVSDTTQVGYRFENLSSASDLALYQSKQYGRNRVYEYDINVEGQGATP